MENVALDYQPRKRDKKLAGRIVSIVFWSVVGPAIIMALIWFWPRHVDSARRGSGIAPLGDLKAALATFEIDNSRYPSTAEGLDALVTCPPGLAATWNRQLDSVPLDKWGRPLRYVSPDVAGGRAYAIYSDGPDGVPGTADDVDMTDKR